jgi:hypothetical protein
VIPDTQAPKEARIKKDDSADNLTEKNAEWASAASYRIRDPKT